MLPATSNMLPGNMLLACCWQHVVRPRNMLPRNMLLWCKPCKRVFTVVYWYCNVNRPCSTYGIPKAIKEKFLVACFLGRVPCRVPFTNCRFRLLAMCCQIVTVTRHWALIDNGFLSTAVCLCRPDTMCNNMHSCWQTTLCAIPAL